MVFSSLIFLFAFLPAVLVSYFLSPPRARNSILLFASLLFYAWGEGAYVLLMLASVLVNWLLGLVTHRCGRTTAGKRAVAASLMVNLALLAAFKYANFIVDSLNFAFLAVHTGPIELAPVHIFGFRFLENFNYPYVAQSVTEFWRRWHISLSSWFRDYLYIPLGGNRISPTRTYFQPLGRFLSVWPGSQSCSAGGGRGASAHGALSLRATHAHQRRPRSDTAPRVHGSGRYTLDYGSASRARARRLGYRGRPRDSLLLFRHRRSSHEELPPADCSGC